MEGAAQTAATAADVTGVLNILKTVVDFLIGCISSIVDVVMANPLLLIPIGVVLTYSVISVFRRLF